LFLAGPHDASNRVDLAAPAAAEAFPTINGDRSTGGEKGTSLMAILRPPDYRPVVYIMGGNPPAAQKTAESIDLSAASPAWAPLPDMNFARAEQFTATLLPDGRVFIAGGIFGGGDGGACEIFDPRNPAAGWMTGPAMKYVRAYHSAFLLLADGSILGGGDPPAGGGPSPHERFFPDAGEVTEVVLLRSGAVTHGYNMSQRGIELVISGAGAGSITVEEPPQRNLAPPGWYLLFILNASRAPSVGRWLRLT
jgi:hypothetical protein